LLTGWDRTNRRGVYLLDCSEPPEVHWHFVFSDARVLSSVRFRSFLRDCRAVERSAEELVREVDTEKAALKRYIEDQHAHIRRTYDPKVRKLHRRRKIVVMKGVFDNLK